MAQERFGIVLNNGKAISGAGVVVLLLTFLGFFPPAVMAFAILVLERTTFEVIATAVGLLIGPGLAVFGLGLLVLRLIGVPFLRPAHEVEGPDDAGTVGPAEKLLLGVALKAGEVNDGKVEQAGGGKLWWVWRLFAALMATGLIIAGVIGLVEGNGKAVMLLGIGIAAGVVAISGRDVGGG
jgi:hypothetical protein